jgi:hypothetical protein
MPPVAVPPWNAQQVLPPIDASDPVAIFRSPYEVSIDDFATRFATSLERCAILQGYLTFRSELRAVGVTDGFQWVDGSFTENVEVLEGRPPGDIDVVTFINDPNDNALALPPTHHDQKWLKQNRKVDHYWVELTLAPATLVQLSAYWYSMWSHRRTAQWKGFLKIILDDPAGDAAAIAHVTHVGQTLGGTP